MQGYNASVFPSDPLSPQTLQLIDSLHAHHTSNMSIVMPLPVFVASDDQEVLRSAYVLGYLSAVYRPGISQQTASGGMIKHLQAHPEDGYNATLEIISDIFMLSRSSSLIGIAASQVFRMAVAMSNASHALKFVAAMDCDAIPKIQALSRKYYVPFPEDFLHSQQAVQVHRKRRR